MSEPGAPGVGVNARGIDDEVEITKRLLVCPQELHPVPFPSRGADVGAVLHRNLATQLIHQPADDQVALGLQIHLIKAHVLLLHTPALHVGGEPQANVWPGATRAVEAHRVAPCALNRAGVHPGPRESLQCSLRHIPTAALVALRLSRSNSLSSKAPACASRERIAASVSPAGPAPQIPTLIVFGIVVRASPFHRYAPRRCSASAMILMLLP